MTFAALEDPERGSFYIPLSAHGRWTRFAWPVAEEFVKVGDLPLLHIENVSPSILESRARGDVRAGFFTESCGCGALGDEQPGAKDSKAQLLLEDVQEAYHPVYPVKNLARLKGSGAVDDPLDLVNTQTKELVQVTLTVKKRSSPRSSRQGVSPSLSVSSVVFSRVWSGLNSYSDMLSGPYLINIFKQMRILLASKLRSSLLSRRTLPWRRSTPLD